MPPSPSVSIAAFEEPPPLPPAPSQPPRTGAPIRPSEKVTDFAVSSLSLPSFAFSLLSARFCSFAVFRFSLRRHVAEDPHELLGGVNAVGSLQASVDCRRAAMIAFFRFPNFGPDGPYYRSPGRLRFLDFFCTLHRIDGL